MIDSAAAAGQAALEVSLAYYQAWTGKNFDCTMTFIAEDIVCDAPSGRLEGAGAFRGFMEPFTTMVTRAELMAAFGDDRAAVLMYDTDTVPVPHAPGAECHTIEGGKITHITIIFDRQPFTQARAAASSG